MEEEHILTANELETEESPKEKGGSGVNKTLLGIVVVLLLVITGGGAYFLGSKKPSTKEEVIPTESPLKSETLGEESEDNADVDTTATDSGSTTPGVSITTTPSVTPKVTINPNFKINPNLKTLQLVPTSTPTPIPTIKFEINKELRPLVLP